MTDQELIWICFEPVVFPYPKILYGSSDPNGDKDIFVPYVPADRIEELVKERDDYKDLYYAAFKDAASLNIHYAEIGYKAKTAEAKLAKAVDALRECQEALRDHMKQYPHMAKGYTVDAEKNARKVLAELEGVE